MTLWTVVCAAADEAPDRVVVADDHGRSLTTMQFRDAAERVAAGLPVSAGQVVSWQAPTSVEALVLMVALNRLGVTQNPVIPQLGQREVGVITSQLEPALFIAPETWRGVSYADRARELGCSVLPLDFDHNDGPELRLPTGDPCTLPAPPQTDPHWVYYSSGTTADPKGVMHTDSSLIAGAAGLIELSSFGAGDIYPIAWPLTHIGGINMLVTSLRAGMRIVTFDAWDPTTTPERMAAHDPTILGSAQPFFRAYIDAQRRHGDTPLFPHLRVITAGGAPTPPEIVNELIEVLGVRGVVGSYGLTEFPIATSTTPKDPDDVLLRSVGQPSPGVDLRIVDGEIRVKGPQRFDGYIDASLDTDAFDSDGYFHTGDVGELDDDGNVYITGRIKDIIIRNAENISALEIEDILLRHPDIADAAVMGLPDPRTGERVCAVIVPRDSTTTIDVPTIATHCQTNGLAKYKCPEQIETTTTLPRNSMGKLLKQQIRQQLLKE